ncbi:GNAT family N-acetyltransferase [Streptomyces albidoflavus]
MRIRPARPDDAPALTALFAANRHDALTERQRAEQGFVQGSFDEAALRAMAGAGNVLVAEEAGALAGLVCLAAPGDVPDPPPPVAALLAAQDRLEWRGRPLSATRWLLYGPVVVGAGHRGKGVARGLYEAALRSAAPRAEAVVAFVERANEASRKVHVDGFGMAVLGEYEVHGRAYEVVAAAARPSA